MGDILRYTLETPLLALKLRCTELLGRAYEHRAVQVCKKNQLSLIARFTLEI